MALTGTVAVVETDTTYGNIVTDAEVQMVVVIDTEAVVREYFADIPIMIQIARCESTFRHTLADGTILRGFVDDRDTGVMQINLGYHADYAEELGLDVEDIFDNMAYARQLYERQGTQPWSASAPCWGKTLASL